MNIENINFHELFNIMSNVRDSKKSNDLRIK